MTQPRHTHAAPISFGLREERLPDDDIPVIAVSGELDLFTAPELRESLRARMDGGGPPVDLVVDLSDCAFVDASGCQALLRAARALASVGRRLAIVNTNPANTRIFSVMGLDELFPIVESRAAAAAALRDRAT